MAFILGQPQIDTRSLDLLLSGIQGMDERRAKSREADALQSVLSKYSPEVAGGEGIDEQAFISLLQDKDISPQTKQIIGNLMLAKETMAGRMAAAQQGGSVAETEADKVMGRKAAESVDALLTGATEARENLLVLNDIEKALKGERGGISGPGLAGTIKNIPYINKLAGAIPGFAETPDEAVLRTASKQLLGGLKGLFGSRPTEREIFLLIEQMLPAVGRGNEQNQASIDVIRKGYQYAMDKSEAAKQIIADNGGRVPLNFNELLDDRMQARLDKLKEEIQSINKSTFGSQGIVEAQAVNRIDSILEKRGVTSNRGI